MRLRSPAAERNREPIAAILRDVLPPRGTVLEIASGTGQHAAFFAQQFPHLTWQPSDPDDSALASVRAWVEHAGAGNLLPPLRLDVTDTTWPVESADAVVNINMVHISPWRACEGLMEGAARLLGPGSVLFMYGPYRVEGRPTAPSNEAFDASLRARDPSWGLRYLHEVEAEASKHAFELESVHDMPANNLSVVFRRTGGVVAGRS